MIKLLNREWVFTKEKTLDNFTLYVKVCYEINLSYSNQVQHFKAVDSLQKDLEAHLLLMDMT